MTRQDRYVRPHYGQNPLRIMKKPNLYDLLYRQPASVWLSERADLEQVSDQSPHTSPFAFLPSMLEVS